MLRKRFFPTFQSVVTFTNSKIKCGLKLTSEVSVGDLKLTQLSQNKKF
jgi:hypothetical protein